jgi:hypothetical protein
MSARVLHVQQVEEVLAPKVVSALNGRIGADILVPPYQRLVETEYLAPVTPHWTDECFEGGAPSVPEPDSQEIESEQILQPRRLSLRVF